MIEAEGVNFGSKLRGVINEYPQKIFQTYFRFDFSASAQKATCRFDRINRKSGRKNEKRTKTKRIARKTLILSVLSVTSILSMFSVTSIVSALSVNLILSVFSVTSILSDISLTFRYLTSFKIYFSISE